MRWLSPFVCGIVTALLASLAHASDDLIPHQVLNRSEVGTIKVALVDDRLPSAGELGALSRHLVGQESKHDRSFIVFYLPDMEVGGGGYATAHHDPVMEVKVLDFMLAQYPQYQELLAK